MGRLKTHEERFHKKMKTKWTRKQEKLKAQYEKIKLEQQKEQGSL